MESIGNRPLVHVHIADIHFGAIDPYKAYGVLNDQFLEKINKFPFDILSIDGDLFDRKLKASDLAVTLASNFVHTCAHICKRNQAAFILIHGTQSHDAGQLDMFEGIKQFCECYIVNQIQFVETHGVKILCIPEEYGKGKDYYLKYLNQVYDLCFMHGTIVGSVPGANVENLDAAREPIFSAESFSHCKGPIISGHVHNPVCINDYMYYVSSPYTWKFGESSIKGFAICISNPYTRSHSYNFICIDAFSYVTLDISSFKDCKDPNEIIQYVLQKKEEMHIDWVRIDCSAMTPTNTEFIRRYIHENKQAQIKIKERPNPFSVDTLVSVDTMPPEISEVTETGKNFLLKQLLLDKGIDDMTKFVMYVQMNEGEDFISVEKLRKVLE